MADQCTSVTAPKPKPRGMPHTMPPILRDVVILLCGAVGFFHELLVHQGPERPMFIFASMAALGLPLALRADGK